MGFYADIKQQYSSRVCQQLKLWANHNLKLASLRNRRIFLLECRRQGLTPRHIRDRIISLYGSISSSDSVRQAERMQVRIVNQIINFEIRTTIKNTLALEKDMIRRWEILACSLPLDILERFKHFQNISYNSKFESIKNNNLKKIQSLNQNCLDRARAQPQWFKNISDISIPNRVERFLALGPKFCIEIPKKEVSIQKLLANIEQLITLKKTNSHEADNTLRSLSTNIVTNYLLNNMSINNAFQAEYYYCKKFLKNQSNLLILQSDKGNVTVAMNREHYHSLVLEILSDEKYYRKVSRDPTSSFQTKANDMIKHFIRKE
ncbi:uncharacterized protein LOC123311688 [Coccinella septempunctata]|uniref:uncharacterized protein LOC123311688 n=1 Tax=Coccinella septempunctata TaxID=41139 RepID=UPI001D08479B|nr:uncharacterized protein LOC123311688 [Coccinella septempunctata]